jgi:hypothetical protein
MRRMAEEFMIGIAAIWAALALGLIPAMTLFQRLCGSTAGAATAN